MKRLQKKYMIFKYLKEKIIYFLVVVLYRFNSYSVIGKQNLRGLDSYIVVTWHGKFLGLMEYLRNKDIYALASLSKDGNLITNVAKNFGYNFFRGSSSRGGKKAMDKMRSFILNNSSSKIAITPDGPTGPEHKVKPGAFLLSRDCSCPVVPIIVDTKKSWKFKNWHTFYLSKPFSKAKVVIGDPLYFAKNDDIDFGTKKIEDALLELDKIASDHE